MKELLFTGKSHLDYFKLHECVIGNRKKRLSVLINLMKLLRAEKKFSSLHLSAFLTRKKTSFFFRINSATTVKLRFIYTLETFLLVF
jgi:hypothetical protein